MAGIAGACPAGTSFWLLKNDQLPPPLGLTMNTLGVKTIGELLCGLIGGPLTVSTLTPCRNAMTLAAKEPNLGFAGIYRTVFARGIVGAYAGGFQPTIAAIPQFTCTGPVYLVAERKFNGNKPAALFSTALIESLLTYRAQARNAQMFYNSSRACASERLAHQPGYMLMGPGFLPHVFRNIMGMVGIRMIAPKVTPTIRQLPGISSLPKEGQQVVADFSASCCSATVSMLCNHIFSYSVCTPEMLKMSYPARAKAQVTWLAGAYMEKGVGLLGRDLAIRITYVATLFTFYRVIERQMGVGV